MTGEGFVGIVDDKKLPKVHKEAAIRAWRLWFFEQLLMLHEHSSSKTRIDIPPLLKEPATVQLQLYMPRHELIFSLSKPSSLAIVAIVVLLVYSAVLSFFYFQTIEVSPTPKPAAAPVLEKFKVGGYLANNEKHFLVVDTGREQGIWANNGLDPEFVSSPPDPVSLNRLVASGINIGIAVASDPIFVRSSGVPVKIVAGYLGLPTCKLAVNANGPIRTLKDLDGKKFGVPSTTSAWYRHALYLSDRSAIKPELVVNDSYGNLTNQVVALKLGRIDAFLSCDGALLRLVDSGEIRVLITSADYLTNPWTSITLFATDELIEQNPDLVRRFVKAWLEAVNYLKDNPGYAVDLYIKKTSAPRDLAEKVVSQITWAPSGLGSGQDLVVAVANVWQFTKDIGAAASNININIEEAVDTRFLP